MNIKKWTKRASVIFFLLVSVIALPLAFPTPLFAYSLASNQLTIHSDIPIQGKNTKAVLRNIEKKLARSPILGNLQPLDLYIANTRWKQTWLWLIWLGKDIGGFVAPPLTRNYAFLSGADFESNELIAPSGYRPKSPRTLEYYGVHELTHVVTANRVGPLYFSFLMPVWIKEGLADYVAMPSESASDLFSKIGENNADLNMIKAHGGYPPYRLLVTYFLEDEDWTIDELLSSKLTLSEARKRAFTKN